MAALLEGLIQHAPRRLMRLHLGVPAATDNQAECALAANSTMVERCRPLPVIGVQILLGVLDRARIDENLRVVVADGHSRGLADPQQPEAGALKMNAQCHNGFLRKVPIISANTSLRSVTSYSSENHARVTNRPQNVS